MLIPIRSENPKEIPEYAVVELQGDLNFDSTSNTGKTLVGDLHFTKAGIPIFIIGIHILYGKEEPLHKPFAVLEKKSIASDDINDTKLFYTVKGIVKKRLIFRARPKPIVVNVPKCV